MNARFSRLFLSVVLVVVVAMGLLPAARAGRSKARGSRFAP
jgi:hypothetical protein